MTEETIEDWLIEHIAEELEIEPDTIDITKPLASYGLDSVAAVSISGELELWLQTKLDPTLLFEYPTIEKISRHLIEQYG